MEGSEESDRTIREVTLEDIRRYIQGAVRDHPFKMSAFLRGEGCPHGLEVKRSQYIRIKIPLHKHFAGMPMVGGWRSKIVKIC